MFLLPRCTVQWASAFVEGFGPQLEAADDSKWRLGGVELTCKEQAGTACQPHERSAVQRPQYGKFVAQADLAQGWYCCRQVAGQAWCLPL